MKRAILAALALAAFGGGAGDAGAADGAIEVADAWARPTIQTRPGAGYFTLRNTGDAPDVLTGAESENAEKVEMHTTAEQNGVVSMLRLESLEIAPGEEVVFEPGHHHLMFIKLAEPLAEGDDFTATLLFEEAGEVEVTFAVGADPADGADADSDDAMPGAEETTE